MGLCTVQTCNVFSFKHSSLHSSQNHCICMCVCEFVSPFIKKQKHIYPFIFVFASLYSMCLRVYVWPIIEQCGIVEKPLGFRFSLETDRFPRILSLGCPQRWLGRICGWWDGWDAACCFLATWNAIYLLTWPTIQVPGRDRDKSAGKTVRDYRVMPVWSHLVK